MILKVIGSARNITGVVQDDGLELMGQVEVVLIGVRPFYGFTGEGQVSKSVEAGELRFYANPSTLRTLATKFTEYADQCEDVFGVEPEPTPKPESAGDTANAAGGEEDTHDD